jgi:hypothetical protein
MADDPEWTKRDTSHKAARESLPIDQRDDFDRAVENWERDANDKDNNQRTKK